MQYDSINRRSTALLYRKFLCSRETYGLDLNWLHLVGSQLRTKAGCMARMCAQATSAGLSDKQVYLLQAFLVGSPDAYSEHFTLKF